MQTNSGKFRVRPATRLGWWAVGLAAASFVLGFLWLFLPVGALISFLCGLAGGVIALIAIMYYNPLHVYGEGVIGKIPYLNTIPFYASEEYRPFKILPVVPRRMGILLDQQMIDAAGLLLARLCQASITA